MEKFKNPSFTAVSPTVLIEFIIIKDLRNGNWNHLQTLALQNPSQTIFCTKPVYSQRLPPIHSTSDGMRSGEGQPVNAMM